MAALPLRLQQARCPQWRIRDGQAPSPREITEAATGGDCQTGGRRFADNPRRVECAGKRLPERRRYGSEDSQRPLGPTNRIDNPNQPFVLLLASDTMRAISACAESMAFRTHVPSSSATGSAAVSLWGGHSEVLNYRLWST